MFIGSPKVIVEDEGIEQGPAKRLNFTGAGVSVSVADGEAAITIGGAGATSFTDVTSGTNTTAAMVVGTGGSLATSGSGTIAATTVVTNANLTGHVTSVGNAASLGSFTVAQLNTAISDGDVATGGGTATGTNTGDQTITLTGDVTGTGTGSFATTIANNAVTTAKVTDANVTYAKIQNVSATNRVLGRSTAGAGVIEEITVGGDLTQSGSTFTIANNAVTTAKILDSNVTLAKIVNVSATQRVIGRNTAGAGVQEEVTIAQLMGWATNLQKRSLSFVIDGGGSAITTGVKGDLVCPFAGTITGWTILGDQSGSIVVDVWKDTYANFPPTVADTIAGTEKPTITTATKGQDLSLSSWTTSVAAGDILRFNVDSITTLTRVTLVILIDATIA